MNPSPTSSEELKKDKHVLKFMAKYRYQYHKEMKSDLVELIAQKVKEEHELWRKKWLETTSEKELKAWSNDRLAQLQTSEGGE